MHRKTILETLLGRASTPTLNKHTATKALWTISALNHDKNGRPPFKGALFAFYFSLFGFAAIADNFDLPVRISPSPETTNSIPHIQLGGVKAIPELSNALLKSVSTLPGVELGNTQLSLAGAVGFQLSKDMDLKNPAAIVGGREFAHLHPDGSLHASLGPELAKTAVAASWA